MEKDMVALRASALDFLKAHDAGVLATVSPDGNPHASIVYYVADDLFNIYFLTKLGSRKYTGILSHPVVAFTIGRQDVPQTLQIEGVAVELTNDDEKRPHVAELMDTLSNNNPLYIPIAKMDSEVVIMWIQPKWIRWADFSTHGIGNDAMFTEIPVTA